MNLRKLKKELKKQGTGTKKDKKTGFGLLLLVLLGCSLAIALTYGYRIYQETIPGRLYSKGLTMESQGRAEQALTAYERLFDGYARSEKAPEALFRAARICRYDLRQDQRALLYFLRLENDYPESGYLPQAQLEAAELTKYRLRDFTQAIVIYQRLLDRGPQDGDRILYEIADCYFRLNNFSQARIELDALLERYPHSPLSAEVLYRSAGAALLDGQKDVARNSFQRLIETYPKSPYALEARFSLAEMLESEERLKEALKAYRGLSNYPKGELLKDKIVRLEQRIAKKKKAL